MIQKPETFSGFPEPDNSSREKKADINTLNITTPYDIVSTCPVFDIFHLSCYSVFILTSDFSIFFFGTSLIMFLTNCF